MLQSAAVTIFTTAIATISFIPSSLAQTPDPTELFPIQNTAPDCPQDIPGCPVRGEYFTWLDQPIPYILSPRRSQTLTPQPILRWRPVEDATSYNIILEGPDVFWRAENITETAIQYNGEPPLQPGIAYQFFVEANTGAVSWDEPDHAGGVGFAVMPLEERLAVEVAVAQRRETITDPPTLHLALADLYLEQQLIGEAIAQLETLWQQEPSAELAVRLGNLYFGWLLLVEPSETYYRQALALATDEEPTLARAIALAQLGKLHIVKQEFDQAIDSWQQAQAVYQAIGEPHAAAELEDDIQRWLEKQDE